MVPDQMPMLLMEWSEQKFRRWPNSVLYGYYDILDTPQWHSKELLFQCLVNVWKDVVT